MPFKKWQNLPFAEVLLSDRVNSRAVAICRGGCNKVARIDNIKYQLCGLCADHWRYHGHSCDVPNCTKMADGSISFRVDKNKILCLNCRSYWQKMGYPIWEHFIESRHLTLLRPKTFVKALVAGLVTPVENPILNKALGECKNCNRHMKIATPLYQLCFTCSKKLQFYGETCSLGGAEPCPNDAQIFDVPESRFVCDPCKSAKNNYNLSSYMVYERYIRSIVNCQLCQKSISHNGKDGRACTAFIDHDHDTGKTRGVLCRSCNTAEGYIKQIGDPRQWIKNLMDYYDDPPLDNSWTQSL